MMDSPRPRTRERLEKRERIILDAAAELFASAGFHATSTRKIAAAAGVAEGTVFHYFGSKHELMVAILDRFYHHTLNPRAAEILDTVTGTRERLGALALHHVHSLTRHNALMMRLLQVYIGVDLEFIGRARQSPLRELNRAYVGHLDRILREGVERDELRRDRALRPWRDVFFGTLEYGLRTHMYRHGARGVEQYVEQLLDPLWRGIQRAAPPVADPHPALDRLNAICARLEETAQRLEN